MKLPVHAWRTLWAYHAWAGVAVSLVVHLMFVAGAMTLFLVPLRLWEEPVHHVAAPAQPQSPQALFARGLDAIRDLPPPRQLWLGLPGDGRAGGDGVPRFQYSDPKTGVWRNGWLAADGRFVPEREVAATFLYHLHYLWFAAAPALQYVAGLLGLAFLLTVVTGVVIHLKDLRRQLTQFRPHAGRRVLWSDMHKVLGVLGLPFQLLWSYSGALVALGPVLITAIAGPVFGGDAAAVDRVAWNEPTGLPRPGAPAPARSLDEVLAIARDAVPGFQPISFGVQDHGKQHALVRAYGRISAAGPDRYADVVIDETTGAVVHVDAAATDLASHAARRWLSGLHYGYFGGTAVRVVLALLAMVGCATILTGNWIWLARRRAAGGDVARRAHVLARLTAGVGAGIFVAIGALLVASRMLPFDVVDRGQIEQLIFAGALVGCLAWALFARVSSAVWWQQLALAGALFASLPAWQARLTGAGLLGGGPRIATVVAVDVGLAVAGVALLAVAWVVRRAGAPPGQRDAWAVPAGSRRPARIAFAVLAVAGAVALWPRGDGALLGCVCVVLWLSVLSVGFVLLEPIAPRAAWIAGAVLVIVLALL
jgi:uncharacterized iron-regulated membrane protein